MGYAARMKLRLQSLPCQIYEPALLKGHACEEREVGSCMTAVSISRRGQWKQEGRTLQLPITI